MSNEPVDTPDDDDELEAAVAAKSEQKANWRRKLEQDAEDGRKARDEAAAARKELAFLKAGVDTDSPQGKLLAKAYDGELTADAVKAAAVEFGIIAPDSPAVPAAELAAHDRIAAAAGGGAGASDEDAALAAIQSAETPEQVLEALTKAGIPVDGSRPGSWLHGAGAITAPVT